MFKLEQLLQAQSAIQLSPCLSCTTARPLNFVLQSLSQMQVYSENVVSLIIIAKLFENAEGHT